MLAVIIHLMVQGLFSSSDHNTSSTPGFVQPPPAARAATIPDQTGANLVNENLSGQYLVQTIFREANLGGADLHRADLQRADFQGANLTGANLQLANMNNANLQDADLIMAHLQSATLHSANLSGANLWNTYLQGTDLSGANLQNATLLRSHFDINTILPDGTRWSEDTDLTRFTNPNHPDFGQPE